MEGDVFENVKVWSSWLKPFDWLWEMRSYDHFDTSRHNDVVTVAVWIPRLGSLLVFIGWKAESDKPICVWFKHLHLDYNDGAIERLSVFTESINNKNNRHNPNSLPSYRRLWGSDSWGADIASGNYKILIIFFCTLSEVLSFNVCKQTC